LPDSMFSLEGKTALVTGGNRGLGRGMALGLREAGAKVVATGRDSEMNESIARELGEDGSVVPLDVRDEEAVQSAVREVVATFGSLDILINNAGAGSGGSVLEMRLEDWEAVVATNLTGSFLCAKHAAKAMVAAGSGGKIINIGSAYSVYGTPSFVDYGATKTGVLGLTRGLAVELAPHDIQVNAILPGWYETDMTREFIPERGEEIRRKTPAGRWGIPEDLVGAAVFLSSEASAFVTGIALPVDGGYMISEKLATD